MYLQLQVKENQLTNIIDYVTTNNLKWERGIAYNGNLSFKYHTVTIYADKQTLIETSKVIRESVIQGFITDSEFATNINTL